MPKKISDIENKESALHSEVPSVPVAENTAQRLRVATIISLNHIDDMTAGSVMTAYNLKASDRLEPLKFLRMVEDFKKRKISKTGRK